MCATVLALAGCASVTTARGDDSGAADANMQADSPVVVADSATAADAQSHDAPPPDAPAHCGWSEQDSLSLSFTLPSGQHEDCEGPRPTSSTPALITHPGAVLSVTDLPGGSSRLVIDLCSPAADCIQLPATLTVTTPTFSFARDMVPLRVGQYVRLRTRTTWTFGCSMQFELSNLAVWDGSPNPVRHDSGLLAAASMGETTPLPGPSFGVAQASTGCRLTGPSCGQPPELFAFSVQGSCNTCLRAPDPVLVPMGESRLFGIDGLTYSFRNLRSYVSGACDDNYNFQWTVRETYLEG